MNLISLKFMINFPSDMKMEEDDESEEKLSYGLETCPLQPDSHRTHDIQMNKYVLRILDYIRSITRFFSFPIQFNRSRQRLSI